MNHADRTSHGRALRTDTPRSSHAAWAVPEEREDPVAVLERQADGRLPELAPVRYGRMVVSPFTFFRGAASIMAADLATTPTTGLHVQASGDAHLLNFGVFAAPDRRVVFDLNDFDETLPAPFEWDLKRLATSAAIAARDNGFSERAQRAAARGVAAAYEYWTHDLAARPFLDAWYDRIEPEPLLELAQEYLKGKDVGEARRMLVKAERRTHLDTLGRLAERTADGFRIKPQPPVIVPVSASDHDAVRAAVDAVLDRYVDTLAPECRTVIAAYNYVDVARKVSGIGSVGTEGFILLLMGHRDDAPLFLQFKQAQASVLAPYTHPSVYASEGARVVHGQRLLQTGGDALLGWCELPDGRDFYIRQLRDKKASLDLTRLSPDGIERYARVCGRCLARAHARSGGIAERAGYLGSGGRDPGTDGRFAQGGRFARAIEDFALAYANQNDADYAALLQAEADGRIAVTRGV